MRHNFSNTQSVPINSGGPNTVTSTIHVADIGGSIRDVNVTIDIDHSWTNDLRIHLVAPNQQRVLLVSGEGGTGDNFRGTTFDDAAVKSIKGASAPFQGTFRPEESLVGLNDLDPNGTWTLEVDDRAFQDGGSLNSWTLSLETCSYCLTSTTPVRIDPGPANTVISEIQVNGLGAMVIEKVVATVDITHTWDNDLKLTLIGPSGTAVVLVDREGGREDNFEQTVFDDDADTAITDGAAPFHGTFRPAQPLAAFTEDLANGTWTLRIEDKASQDGGTLNSWDLQFEVRAATPRVPSNFSIEVRFVGGLTANQRSVFQLAAARWAEAITGDLPSAIVDGEEIDDLLIFAEGVEIDGSFGVLGRAGPVWVRAGSGLPVVGEMQFDSADLADMEADGSLIDVIIHEMGHVIGIGTIWDDKNLLQSAGTDDPVFTGTHAVAEYRALTGNDQETSVPVANTGGVGTADSHWREATFDNELMTGTIDLGVNPLSRMSIASLRDLGYDVTLAPADAYQLPGPSLFSIAASVRRACLTTCRKPKEVPPRGTGSSLLETVRRDTRHSPQRR